MQLSLNIDILTIKAYKIRFKKGEIISLETIKIITFLSLIIFHVVPINISFLYYINNIDRIRIKLNNLRNVLI